MLKQDGERERERDRERETKSEREHILRLNFWANVYMCELLNLMITGYPL